MNRHKPKRSPAETTSMDRLGFFQIMCTHCQRETWARKLSRIWRGRWGHTRLVGMNQCITCRRVYDATLTEEELGQRRPVVSEVAAQTALQQLQ